MTISQILSYLSLPFTLFLTGLAYHLLKGRNGALTAKVRALVPAEDLVANLVEEIRRIRRRVDENEAEWETVYQKFMNLTRSLDQRDRRARAKIQQESEPEEVSTAASGPRTHKELRALLREKRGSR
jgi:hypothetical protein